MSDNATKTKEERRAASIVEIAKHILPSVIHTMGVPENARDVIAIRAHYDTVCNTAFSVAKMFREKAEQFVERESKPEQSAN